MLKAILAVVGLLLLAMGAEGLFYFFSNRQPVSLTCALYARSRPEALWLRLTECNVDYLAAGYRESGGRIRELLFPVRPAGVPRTEPAALVAATQDSSVLAIAQNTIGNGRQPTQEQYLVMMLEIVTRLRVSRELDGFARAGVVSGLNARRAISGLSAPIVADAALLDIHARPSLAAPLIATGAGLGALGAAIALMARRRRAGHVTPPAEAEIVVDLPTAPSAAEADTASAAGAADAASPATIPRLGALLLLNLPPLADIGEIENAPPLGGREAVIKKIVDAVPGVQFDRGAHGTMAGPDVHLSIDLGTDRLVHTAVVRAEGVDAIDALKTIIESAGWRAYSPKSGTFVDAGRLHATATTVQRS